MGIIHMEFRLDRDERLARNSHRSSRWQHRRRAKAMKMGVMSLRQPAVGGTQRKQASPFIQNPEKPE
jgi:hypothetical protein